MYIAKCLDCSWEADEPGDSAWAQFDATIHAIASGDQHMVAVCDYDRAYRGETAVCACPPAPCSTSNDPRPLCECVCRSEDGWTPEGNCRGVFELDGEVAS